MATVLDNHAKSGGDENPSAKDTSPSVEAVRQDRAHSLPEPLLKELVRLFKLLADETRMRILFLLVQRGEVNVRTLCEFLGQSQPAVSHHLALMRGDGLIDCRREGKHNFYRVLPSRLESLFRAVSPDAESPSYEQFRHQVLSCMER